MYSSFPWSNAYTLRLKEPVKRMTTSTAGFPPPSTIIRRRASYGPSGSWSICRQPFVSHHVNNSLGPVAIKQPIHSVLCPTPREEWRTRASHFVMQFAVGELFWPGSSTSKWARSSNTDACCAALLYPCLTELLSTHPYIHLAAVTELSLPAQRHAKTLVWLRWLVFKCRGWPRERGADA